MVQLKSSTPSAGGLATLSQDETGADPRLQSEKTKIICIVAGAGRAGTTLVSRLLGEIEGCVNIGEVNQLVGGKIRGADDACGCGSPLDMCPFWKGVEETVPDEVQEYDRRWLRTRWFPLLLVSRRLGFRSTRFRQFLQTLETTYAEIARRAGCRVIVESSKAPVYLSALTQVANADVYMLHLVRNPLGVVMSWRKKKGHLPQHGALKILVLWSLYNIWYERLGRRVRWYRRIRFEEFAAKPQESLQSIADEIFGQPVTLPFLGPNRARIHEQHHLAGNPDKLTLGEIVIRGETASPASPGTRILTRLLTFPLLQRYGYL